MSAPSLHTSAEASARQDAWWWRLFATGMAFVLFGLGGLVLRLVVFPVLRLRRGDQQIQQVRARKTIGCTFRHFIRFMVRTGILVVDFRGAERLGRPGQMIIANHPSLLDVVFLIGHVANTNCIVKHQLVCNTFTRGPIAAAGYISNSESFDMLHQAAQVLLDGESLIVFPEGSRTPRDKLPRFHRGACAIALRGASVITPVVIRMTPRSLTKGEPWYKIPHRRLRYSIHVGADIDPSDWKSQAPLPIAGRRLNDHLHSYFDFELSKHGKSQSRT